MPEPKIGHGDLAAFAGRVVNLPTFFVTAPPDGSADRTWHFVDNKFWAGVVRVGSTIRWTGVPAALASRRCRVRF